jgi:hypothetical protein
MLRGSVGMHKLSGKNGPYFEYRVFPVPLSERGEKNPPATYHIIFAPAH